MTENYLSEIEGKSYISLKNHKRLLKEQEKKFKSGLFLYRNVRRAPRSKNNLYPKHSIVSLPFSFLGEKVKIQLVKRYRSRVNRLK